ncbi:GntR family transcriptional regulator [Rhodoblastus acidophilus]|nr:GntR family transcriptional regulator [Rhodoblastus acidophilus]
MQIMLSSERLIESLAPDRGLAEPVYKQMARAFNKMLETGEIGEGQSLPAERLLAEKLDLSRTTVRRFYEELRKDDLLSTSRRNGAVAKAPQRLSPRMGPLKGFTDEMRELGMEPSTRLLARDIVRDRVVASVFNRPSTAHFLRLVRLRLGDGTPLSREIAWFDLALAPEMAEWNVEGSAYAYLSNSCGIRLGAAEQSIEAVLSSDEENAAFGFDSPQPCLLIKRKSRALTGQLVEYVEGTFRGDAYTYRLNLEPSGGN